MNEKLAGLAELLHHKTTKIVEEAKFKSYIDGDRIVLTVSKDGVKAAISEMRDRPKKRPSLVTPEEKEKINKIRKALKGDLNLTNLVILLVRVKEEINRIKIGSLSQEKLAIVKEAVLGIKDSAVLQRLLEYKG